MVCRGIYHRVLSLSLPTEASSQTFIDRVYYCLDNDISPLKCSIVQRINDTNMLEYDATFVTKKLFDL